MVGLIDLPEVMDSTAALDRTELPRSVIVIGGEPNGVMENYSPARKVIIPMPGDYESLNAAQAATIIIFESVRRKLAAGK
jgi:TrmH family RNA methyltransferase